MKDWLSLRTRAKAESLMEDLFNMFKIDFTKPGLEETPKRFVKMMEELLEGELYTNDEIALMFNKTFELEGNNELVIVRDIPIFSLCEHHIALMYDMTVTIAYIPKNKVLGLSKFARIAELVGKRLQLQERIGTDILEIVQKIVEVDTVAVVIKGKHACMMARGIKSDAMTQTSALGGEFLTDSALRSELYQLIGGLKK